MSPASRKHYGDAWASAQAKVLKNAPDGVLTPELAVRFRDVLVEMLGVTYGRALQGSVERAAVILWKRELWDAAQVGARSFVGTAALCPPAHSIESQLWVFDQGFIDETFARLGPGSQTVAIWIAAGKGDGQEFGTAIWWVLCSDADGSFLMPMIANFSGTIDRTFVNIAAGLHFLTHELVAAETATLPRSLRRAAECGRRGRLPEVKTVRLRRTAAPSTRAGMDSEREYSCQWLVGAHWRRQWLPSKATHEPRFIAPYVKGPEGKPLRQPRATVHVVNR